MKPELKFQLKRKSMHIILTIYPLLLFYLNVSSVYIFLFSICYLFIWLIFELLRIEYNLNTPSAMLIKYISHHDYSKQKDASWKRWRIPYWILGYIIAQILFWHTFIIASVIMLSFGDSASALSRAAWSPKCKPLGIVVGACCGFIIIFLLTNLIIPSILASIIGISTELLNNKVNDNLTIPIFAAFGFTIGLMI